MQIDPIRSFVHADLEIVDRIIADYLGSDITLIRQLSQHICGSGGKRVRPLLVLLGAHVFDYQGEHHHMLAGIVELIHTATLLHDDVVDDSTMRRGEKTANNIWGNKASILVGDYLYSRAFQMMIVVNSMPIMAVLADAANILAEGEVMQLMNCYQPEVTEEQYMQIIQRKTAVLFQAAAQLGALLCHRCEQEVHAMANYGLHIGMAFQLVDDALDYGSSDQDIGKNIGGDLMEGKPTLPLIYAMKQGNKEQQKLIRDSIMKGEIDNLASIKEAIESTQAIEYTYRCAKQHVETAIKFLHSVPDVPARQVMCDLAEFAVARKF
jgi:octaprenyl-diphosphate synthase